MARIEILQNIYGDNRCYVSFGALATENSSPLLVELETSCLGLRIKYPAINRRV